MPNLERSRPFWSVGLTCENAETSGESSEMTSAKQTIRNLELCPIESINEDSRWTIDSNRHHHCEVVLRDFPSIPMCFRYFSSEYFLIQSATCFHDSHGKYINQLIRYQYFQFIHTSCYVVWTWRVCQNCPQLPTLPLANWKSVVGIPRNRLESVRMSKHTQQTEHFLEWKIKSLSRGSGTATGIPDKNIRTIQKFSQH